MTRAYELACIVQRAISADIRGPKYGCQCISPRSRMKLRLCQDVDEMALAQLAVPGTEYRVPQSAYYVQSTEYVGTYLAAHRYACP